MATKAKTQLSITDLNGILQNLCRANPALHGVIKMEFSTLRHRLHDLHSIDIGDTIAIEDIQRGGCAQIKVVIHFPTILHSQVR